jgi:hypothetical protein
MRHPQTNEAAFGYATRLAINGAGRAVCVAYDGLSDGAARIINSLSAKVSAKIRLPGNPQNTSGGFEFDHVGFFPKGEDVSLDQLKVAQFSTQKVSFIRVKNMDEEELLAAQAKLKADQEAFAKKTAQFNAASQVLPIVAELVAKGAIAPKDQAGMVDVFTKLAMVPAEQFSAEFAASRSGGNAAIEFLAQAIAKKAIPYGKDNSQAAAESAEFAAMSVDEDEDEDPSMAMDKKIKAKMKANPGMSYAAAMSACAPK